MPLRLGQQRNPKSSGSGTTKCSRKQTHYLHLPFLGWHRRQAGKAATRRLDERLTPCRLLPILQVERQRTSSISTLSLFPLTRCYFWELLTMAAVKRS